MGFPVGPEDRPFSERMWGLGRSVSPTSSARRGCLVMLVAALLIVVAAVVLAVALGTF